MGWKFIQGDCENLPFDDNEFDIVVCSPPYESQRTYEEVGFNLRGEEYVRWAVRCFQECLRVCRGGVFWVIEGYTEDFEYSASPFMLIADLKRAGVKLRKPLVYHRQGIPGSGGKDFLRNDWEPIICATKDGKFPWSDNTAMGKVTRKYGPRRMSSRSKDGTRAVKSFSDPDVSNPGNVIFCAGGNNEMGWPDSYLNEAPYPEFVPEFLIRSFCPPGGKVLDPFSGSGTTVAVAHQLGRDGVGVDLRPSQLELGTARAQGLTLAAYRAGQGTFSFMQG